MTLRLIVAALATWRLCSLLLYEAGPWEVFTGVRSAAARWTFTADLLSCIYCLSVWVGFACAICALFPIWVVMVPFALSAVAIGMDQCLKRLSK